MYIFLFTSFSVFAQTQINLRDFVRLNDIGIKIIDQKALKEHIEELELDKKQEKEVWLSIKTQKKEIKPELKEYNKLVYERRRQEETAVRMGNEEEGDEALPYAQKVKESQESIHAKKEELIFNKKESDVVEEEEIAEPVFELIPPRRKNFPWNKESATSNCNLNTFIDPIFKDTTKISPSWTIYDNRDNFLRKDDFPLANCSVSIQQEREMLFVQLNWDEKYENSRLLWAFAESDLLSIQLNDGTPVDLPYSGIRHKAISNKNSTEQKFTIRFEINQQSKKMLSENTIARIQILTENRQEDIPVGRRWISKSDGQKVEEFFITFLPCFN
jgi:hypothetical protein